MASLVISLSKEMRRRMRAAVQRALTTLVGAAPHGFEVTGPEWVTDPDSRRRVLRFDIRPLPPVVVLDVNADLTVAPGVVNFVDTDSGQTVGRIENVDPGVPPIVRDFIADNGLSAFRVTGVATGKREPSAWMQGRLFRIARDGCVHRKWATDESGKKRLVKTPLPRGTIVKCTGVSKFGDCGITPELSAVNESLFDIRIAPDDLELLDPATVAHSEEYGPHEYVDDDGDCNCDKCGEGVCHYLHQMPDGAMRYRPPEDDDD